MHDADDRDHALIDKINLVDCRARFVQDLALWQIDGFQARPEPLEFVRRQKGEDEIARRPRNRVRVAADNGVFHGCVLSLKADKMLRQSAASAAAIDIWR